MTKIIGIAIIAAAVVAMVGVLADHAISQTPGGGEVRVAARVQDGRVEFAIQQRDDSSSRWGQRETLGRLPATPTEGTWYTSRPVTVTAAEKMMPTTTQPSTAPAGTFPFVGTGQTPNGFFYWAEDKGITGFQSGVELSGNTTDSTYDEARLWFACDKDGGTLWMGMFIGAWLSYSKEWIKGSVSDRTYIAEAKFGKTYEGTWQTYGLAAYDEQVEIGNASSFMAKAKQHRWLSVRVPRYDGTVTATFDLGGAFDTPVQRNLDECGNY